jgi:hypothetical protein
VAHPFMTSTKLAPKVGGKNRHDEKKGATDYQESQWAVPYSIEDGLSRIAVGGSLFHRIMWVSAKR